MGFDPDPHWVSPTEQKELGILEGRHPGGIIFSAKTFGWYATDESYSNLYGPFDSKVKALEWQRVYGQSLFGDPDD